MPANAGFSFTSLLYIIMINYPKSAMNWINLPDEQKNIFNRIAAKDGDPNMDGQDWFDHLVPSELQDNASEVEVFMNGGTVEQQVWVYDQGTNSGHYETVSYEISDKDVSRIQSGHNGGEYNSDNTIMEDASTNRSRGSDNMTETEVADAQSIIESETVLVDGGEITTEAQSVVPDAASAATEATESILDSVLESVLPVTYGAKAAQSMWDHTDHMPTEERVAVTALAGGGATLATYAALTIPGVNIVLGGIALYKVGTAAHKWATSQQ